MSKKPKTREFRLHWRDGKKEEIKGSDIADAMRHAGIGGGAIRALDYYEEIKVKRKASKARA